MSDEQVKAPYCHVAVGVNFYVCSVYTAIKKTLNQNNAWPVKKRLCTRCVSSADYGGDLVKAATTTNAAAVLLP